MPKPVNKVLLVDARDHSRALIYTKADEIPGWTVVCAEVHDDLFGLAATHRCHAVIITPAALASVPVVTLSAFSSALPLLISEPPFHNWLQSLLARMSNDDAPVQVSKEVKVENSFSTLLEQYEYQSRLFNYVTSSTPDFIYVFNLKGQFIYVNQGLLSVWGRTLEEVIGKTCIELGYEQWHHDMHMREIAEVIETKQPIRGEVPFKAPLTGIFGIYEYIFTPVLTADGGVEVVAGTTRDVTKRKSAEEGLRQSKQLLEVALSASRTGTFRWDPVSDEFLTFDDTFRDIFGIAEDDVLATSHDIFRYIHPDDRHAVETAVEGVAKGNDLVMEFRVCKPDESITWVFDRAKTIRNPDGTMAYVVGACTDITRLKEAELELRAVEQQRQFIMESMPQKIFVTSPDGASLYTNSIWLDYTGLEPEQMSDTSLLLHPDDHVQSVEKWKYCLDTGKPFYIEHRFRSKEGQYRWHVTRAHAMKNASGEVQLWIGSSTDVHDMKIVQQKLEEREDRLASLNLELQQTRDAALAASAAKSMFLASMSHELRTPLNAIIGYSEMLKDELTDVKDESIVSDLNKILLSGKHLLSVISDILDISKIEAGKMEFEVETFSVYEVVQEAILLVMPLVEKNANTVECHCNPDLPLMLTTDRIRLRQVLFNLLSNAAKFTRQGIIAVNCQIYTAAPDARQYVEISVADTGIGIPTDKMKELFEEFSQLEPGTHRMFGGTGLGLAISRRLCQLLGGDIEAYSEQGKGSVFTVRLPVQTDLSVCRFDNQDLSVLEINRRAV